MGRHSTMKAADRGLPGRAGGEMISGRMDLTREWLETDGEGGFASGTAGLVRTRRYHALLVCAAAPPAARFVLVNGLEVWAITPAGRFALSSQKYEPGVVFPDGADRIESFEADPWPRWDFLLPDGARVAQEVFFSRRARATVVAWRAVGRRGGLAIEARPLLSGREAGALHRENPAFPFDPERRGDAVVWRPYPGVPAIAARSNGSYRHAPEWYRSFLYDADRSRGFEAVEDLAAPGTFVFDLSRRPAVLALSAGPPAAGDTLDLARLRAAESRRRVCLGTRLGRAAEDYVVRRGQGRTVLAGYPWFADWGRDTFVSLRGLCLSTGRLEEARQILLEWAGTVSEGMLPNRFPESGGAPEYNSVDASLWFAVAVHGLFEAFRRRRRGLAAADRSALERAVSQILDGYARGTRFGIRRAEDGLLAAGEPGRQLTWMDARVGDRVVTPRIGKPVEVQALWINALEIGGRGPQARVAREAFAARFWNEAAGALYDVVDADHVSGRCDGSFRPNQILAVGGLPFPILSGGRARRLVDAVEERLWTPLGLRSLAPGEPGYRARYEGDAASRDSAYHQGTAWPWLLGPFVEAWVRVRGSTASARRLARQRFLAPVLAHLSEAGLGHVSEIADGDPPHTPRGCPFQAWSVAETLRLESDVLSEGPGARAPQ
jgi:predicted glycogen debranching enzyme